MMQNQPHREQSGQSVKQNWDCSQIKSEEEEDWQKGNQVEVQWDEDEKWEEILERRRMDGSSLEVGFTQKVPELVVHERLAHGEEVKGWSDEEMKETRRKFFWKKTQKN